MRACPDLPRTVHGMDETALREKLQKARDKAKAREKRLDLEVDESTDPMGAYTKALVAATHSAVIAVLDDLLED